MISACTANAAITTIPITSIPTATHSAYGCNASTIRWLQTRPGSPSARPAEPYDARTASPDGFSASSAPCSTNS